MPSSMGHYPTCLYACPFPYPLETRPGANTTLGVDPIMKVLGVSPTYRPRHSAPRLALIPTVTALDFPSQPCGLRCL
ncbi:hypothetical protein LOK49_LG11G02639 [Camellia lanceoleosa]|uniref:Uncharacterized protein n=1 Tax=Camellia lanceoleosa TaxID=1840588 RepID=A0ACC0FYP1_9ERIC|nr:hypothetical protein LOK49_LG11G02639 [Camellia lanceoleosa]